MAVIGVLAFLFGFVWRFALVFAVYCVAVFLHGYFVGRSRRSRPCVEARVLEVEDVA